MAHILLIHGPNLNLLGTREPEHYGHLTLESINSTLKDKAEADGNRLSVRQSNSEGELVDCIQQAPADEVDFIIINPAAFTHTSVAIRDALVAVNIPFVEIHLSNVHAREPFRHRSYFSDKAVGVIAGFGALGYEMAYDGAIRHLEK